MAAVKNVGEGGCPGNYCARRQGGVFLSLDDFCQQVDLHQVNKQVIESLILCGAFDSLRAYRSQLMAIIDECMENAQAARRTGTPAVTGQISLLDMLDEPVKSLISMLFPRYLSIPKGTVGTGKRDVGFYISGHPLEDMALSLPENKYWYWRIGAPPGWGSYQNRWHDHLIKTQHN